MTLQELIIKQREEFRHKWEGSNADLGSKTIDSMIQDLISCQEEIIAKVVEEIDKEINFIQEGIDACYDDSKDDDLVGNELHYVFGKSQVLKMIGSRLANISSLLKATLTKEIK